MVSPAGKADGAAFRLHHLGGVDPRSAPPDWSSPAPGRTFRKPSPTNPLAKAPVSTWHRTGRLHKRTPTLTTKGPEFFDYNARGQVTAQWGSGTSPQANGYDALGRQTTLTTFRSATGQLVNPDTNPAAWTPVPTTADAATTWIYPPFLDLLLAKRYQGTTAPANDLAYTYNPNGQSISANLFRMAGWSYSQIFPTTGGAGQISQAWRDTAGRTTSTTSSAESYETSNLRWDRDRLAARGRSTTGDRWEYRY